MLKIDPATERVTTVGQPLSIHGKQKWDSVAPGDDGRLYCSPRTSDYVLCIDVTAQSVYCVGGKLTDTLGMRQIYKASGGACAAADGSVYMIHHFMDSKILRVAPPTPEWAPRISLLPTSKEGFGEGWWLGAALGPDGCIYYMPGEANRVLRWDPATKTKSLIGPQLFTGSSAGLDHKWVCGVLGTDGCICARGQFRTRSEPLLQPLLVAASPAVSVSCRSLSCSLSC